MPFFIRLVANAVALLLIGYLLPQVVAVDGVMAALAAAFVLGLVNAVVRPLFVILTLPVTIVTLGPSCSSSTGCSSARHRCRPGLPRERVPRGGGRLHPRLDRLLDPHEGGPMSVTLTFLGGAREVTGSCILVQTARNRFLVDCGMFQGGGESDRKNARRMPVPPASIDFVLCTHAHIDHSGLLPKLVKDGFRGPVHCTDATADLLDIMLPDSGHIQEREAEWQTRKRQRGGKKRVPPSTPRPTPWPSQVA